MGALCYHIGRLDVCPVPTSTRLSAGRAVLPATMAVGQHAVRVGKSHSCANMAVESISVKKMEQSAGRAIDTSAGASNACGWSLALWFLRSSRMREFHICWRLLLTKQHNGEHCHEPSGVTNQLGPIAPTQ